MKGCDSCRKFFDHGSFFECFATIKKKKKKKKKIIKKIKNNNNNNNNNNKIKSADISHALHQILYT